LTFLLEERERLGDAFVLTEEGAVFSRTAHCKGVVAVFGAARQRAVLTDLETFGMPPSAARQLALDERLTNLNHSLHSMRGERHASQKRVLSSVLDGVNVGAPDVGAMPEGAFGLLSTMREVTLRLASNLLFGDEGQDELVSLLTGYFHLRREAASPAAAQVDTEGLREVGEALDEALRASQAGGLLGRLRAAGLTEDEVVGHANILFVSSTEPIAVALTWTLLILSQLPEVRAALREEDGTAHPSLLDCVISESLRILPPNGIMVRLTTRATTLEGIDLPEDCEIVLSPFVAHRDAERFPSPDSFQPERWRTMRPSPYDYFPFGAGGHACVGRGLALTLMKHTLAAIVKKHDLLLDGDQDVDWRLHIQFMPANDPIVRAHAAGIETSGGTLRGPVAELLRLAH
jgi:cytochrome P450